MQLDEVQLVDEQDQPIGKMDKVAAHRGEGVRHRAISVFLFNSRGETVIQRRSEQKIVGAGLWANTCCGNVWPNETREACARRRLQVELGITEHMLLEPLDLFEYHIRCNEEFSEWEIDQIFVGEYNGEVCPNPAEVQETRWISPQDLSSTLKLELHTVVPWLPILLQQPLLAQRWKECERKS